MAESCGSPHRTRNHPKRKKITCRTSSKLSGHRALQNVKMLIVRSMEPRVPVAETEASTIHRRRTTCLQSSDETIRVVMNIIVSGLLNNSNQMTSAARKTSQETRVAGLAAETQTKAARCRVRTGNLMLECRIDAATKPIKGNTTTSTVADSVHQMSQMAPSRRPISVAKRPSFNYRKIIRSHRIHKRGKRTVQTPKATT